MMVLDPESIKRNIGQIGKREARTFLREWISGSEDAGKRREALQAYISLDDGKDFRFYEQLFLTDEDGTIRRIAGVCLKQYYFSDKKLLGLLQFVLFEKLQVDIEPKLFAIELLNSINKRRARRVLRNYLKKLTDSVSEKISEERRGDFPKNMVKISSDYNAPLSEELLDVLINLTLAEYYERVCHYNITLMEGLIVQLNCEGANLGAISEIKGMDKLTHLVYLNLHRNRIERVEQLGHLGELRSLNVSENNLQKIEPRSYEGLRNLRELDLASNQIKEMDSISLKSLTKLSLDRNEISEIRHLDDLESLEILNLSHNKIERIEGLDKLINLKSLNLSFNKISEITGLETLDRLQILHLSNNRVNEIAGLGTLYDLRVLTLSNNNIEQVENLDNLVSLRKLELSDNKLRKITGLKHQVQLQELFLDRNWIQKIEGLESLSSLIILFLQNNEIEEFSLDDIRYLRNLNFIYLNENPLNEESKAVYHRKTRFP